MESSVKYREILKNREILKPTVATCMSTHWLPYFDILINHKDVVCRIVYGRLYLCDTSDILGYMFGITYFAGFIMCLGWDKLSLPNGNVCWCLISPRVTYFAFCQQKWGVSTAKTWGMLGIYISLRVSNILPAYLL